MCCLSYVSGSVERGGTHELAIRAMFTERLLWEKLPNGA